MRTHVSWQHENHSKKLYSYFHIKKEQALYLDTLYDKRIRQVYKGNKSKIHDHLQPVQYLLFNRQGYLQSFMINCNVHVGFPFVPRWNYEKRFDTFPTVTMMPVDSMLTLSKLNGLITDTADHIVNITPKDYDYTEVIFFSRIFYRVAKHLIKQAKQQDKKGYRVQTLYVFSDNNFIWMQADSTLRKKITDNYNAVR